MLNFVARQRLVTILVLVAFSIVIALFAALHSMNVFGGNGTSHQSDAYSCLFTFCVAIFTTPMLLTVFLFTFAIPEFFPSPGSHFLFRIEKPPRR